MAGIIAIDAGTTGVTCLYFDASLRATVRAYAEFEQHFPAPDRVEHHADELLAAVDRALGEVLSDQRAQGAVAIGITNQRETVFACERASGAALAPGIVWQDRRTADACARWRREGREDLVRERTGLVIDPYFSGSKIWWMLREHAGLRGRAERGEVVFATVESLVAQHLTGGANWTTDTTNASRTLLFDIDARRWDPELCAWLEIDPAWLPEVREPSASAGLTDSARCHGLSLPILGTIGDQQAALLGQGAVEPGASKNTYGTGCFLLVQCGRERPQAVRGFVTTLACDATGGTSYALEGSLFMGGALVQWLRDGLGIIADASEVEALAASVPDSAGVVLAPGFTGLGAPYWDSDARGALLGLTRGTTRAHVARATLESIALENAELIELVRREGGLAVDELVVDGGAAKNDLLMQMQADLAGTRIVRPDDVEATARGAAVLAGLGAGVVARADALERSGVRTFEPRLEAAERGRRLARWRAEVQRTLTRA